MAVDVMGNVHVVWSDDFERPNSIWGEGIFYTMWDGQAWNLPIDVLLSPDGSSGYAHIPAIASDRKGTIHVVWTDAYQLYYSQAPAVSAGGALSWSSPQLVAGSVSGWTRTYFSDITVDNGGTIHVVWEETLDPGVMRDIDVYYSRSTDGGTSWSEITNVSHCLQVSCRRPSIAADESGGVHVVWAANNEETLSLDTGDEVYYIASLDGGDSWLEPERMDESANLSGLPIVVVGQGGRVHVVWQEGVTPDLYLLHRSWDGAIWSTPTTVFHSTESRWVATWPAAAVDDAGNIHVVWFAGVSGAGGSAGAVQYTCSVDGGNSWTNPETVAGRNGSGTDGWDPRPEVGIDLKNQIHVVWYNCPSADECEMFHSSAQLDLPPKAAEVAQNPGLLTLSPTPSLRTTITPSPAIRPQLTVAASRAVPVVASPPEPVSSYSRELNPDPIALGAMTAILFLGAATFIVSRRRQ